MLHISVNARSQSKLIDLTSIQYRCVLMCIRSPWFAITPTHPKTAPKGYLFSNSLLSNNVKRNTLGHMVEKLEKCRGFQSNAGHDTNACLLDHILTKSATYILPTESRVVFKYN